jgi:hypothetical protein
MPAEWQCQYCNIRCELPEDSVQRSGTTLLMDNALGPRVFFLTLSVCPNQNCRQLHAVLTMYEMRKDEDGTLCPGESPLKRWQLIPSTTARQLPDFVPRSVAKEYEEATGIKEMSPDAAATLARRCLQAIIRDFWGVKKNFLNEELEAVKEKIDPDTWDAIEAVRQTGNIGRHMEKGVNLVIEAEPQEADILLGLVEYLIDEWYVARRQRQERLNKFKGLRPADGSPQKPAGIRRVSAPPESLDAGDSFADGGASPLAARPSPDGAQPSSGAPVIPSSPSATGFPHPPPPPVSTPTPGPLPPPIPLPSRRPPKSR